MAPKIYLLNFIPEGCPNCGASYFALFRDALNKSDYLASASHTCTYCGVHYQYVPDASELLAVAGKYGDMPNHVKDK